MSTYSIVSGATSSVADLGKDEPWLQEWLKEDPRRLGLGNLEIADGEPVQDEDGNPAFLATDDQRYFSVDVRLGEMDASHGFQVLDNWARNRVRHPDKTHVAVLVTETAGDRYRTTLEALTEHLPLVVVELQVWRGDSEAILVPYVAMASGDVDLVSAPATAAAAAVNATRAAGSDARVEDAAVEDGLADADADADDDATESDPADKDDTGIDDPWRLPKRDAEDLGSSEAEDFVGVGSN